MNNFDLYGLWPTAVLRLLNPCLSFPVCQNNFLFCRIFPVFASDSDAFHFLTDPFVTLSCQSHADLLDDLDDDDQDCYGHQHDVGLITVITIVDGNTTQSAAADRACHGRIAEYGGGGDSRSD